MRNRFLKLLIIINYFYRNVELSSWKYFSPSVFSKALIFYILVVCILNIIYNIVSKFDDDTAFKHSGKKYISAMHVYLDDPTDNLINLFLLPVIENYNYNKEKLKRTNKQTNKQSINSKYSKLTIK